ncbi:MAG: hypothetical protein ACKOXK_02185 [Chakrabartia sp.]
MLQRTNTGHPDGPTVRCNMKDKDMARLTQLASVAIGLMTQGILIGIMIGA